MPKYIANVYLQHEGRLFQTGQLINLSEETAEKLGDKVTLSEESKLEALKVAELKEEAKAKGIEGYSDMKKDKLIEALVEDKE